MRGVNVGGNTLKMERLRELLAGAGCQNVRTYVQSGNAVFEGKGTAAQWTRAIEKCLVGQTRLPVTVIVRTASELANLVARNPFLCEPGIDLTKLYVTFLAEKPSAEAINKLAALDAGPDAFRMLSRHLFLHCPGGYGRSKLAGATLERVLGVRTTTRNWNTATTLLKITNS